MEAGPQSKAKAGVTGAFNLVPAGVLHRRRRYVAGRFPLGHPNFGSGEYSLELDPQTAASSIKQRDSGQAAAQPPPALLISSEQQAANGGAGKQLQGIPRMDAGNNYFVLMKAGRDFCVYPLDTSYTFKPLVRPTAQSVDDLEAAQKQATSASTNPGAASRLFMPKSVRRAMQDARAAEAADRALMEEALPILKDRVAELAVKYSSGSTERDKLLLDAGSEEEESEGTDDDMGALEDGDFDGRGKKGRNKGKKGRPAAEPKSKKEGAKGVSVDAGDDVDDELANDIYEGEEDELRPVKPTEDVDWEFDEEAADDDLEQGASEDDDKGDDPGLRKALGLEGDDDEEEAEKAKEEKLAQQAAAADAAAAAKEAAAKDAAAAGGDGAASAAAEGDDDMLDVDESEFDADDLDKLAEERERDDEASPPIKRRKRSATPPAAVVARGAAARGSTPGARRAATPPTAAVTAAATAGRAATPPLGAAARAAGSRKTPPPGGRRATPPPPAAPKRKREEATAPAAASSGVQTAVAAGAPATGGLAPWEWSLDQLDAAGVPTAEGIVLALSRMGPVPTEQLQLLQERLNLVQIGNEGKTVFKKRLLQVAKVGIIDGRKYMVLK